MINVLQILPGIDGGGVGGVIYTYCKNLDTTKITVDLAALNTTDGHAPYLYSELKKSTRNLWLLDRHSYVKRIIEFIKILKTNRYDIVHCHLEEASAIYLFIAMLMGVKIRIAHGHISQAPSFFSISGLKRFLYPLLLITATHKFACGLFAAKKLWRSPKDVFVMTNAIELNKFEHNEKIQKIIQNKLKIPPDTFVIGTIGRFHPQKNPEFILEIIKSYKQLNTNFKFIWAGDGELKQEIEKKASQLCLLDNILFLGHINNANEILMILDAFILPSLYEGLPIVGVEAQAADVQSLFSETITKEVHLHPTTKFLSITDSKKWAIELENIRKNKALKHQETNCLQSSLYNIKNATKALEKRYEDILKELK
jgi:glycosyltransferase EpsF